MTSFESEKRERDMKKIKKSCLLSLNPAKYTNNTNNKRTTIDRQGYSIITTERDKVKEASHRADFYY